MNIETAKRGITTSGRTLLISHLEGNRLCASQAIKAKCFECMGGFPDGRADCKIPECPLYRWMPYRSKINSEGGNTTPVETNGISDDSGFPE